MGVFTAASALDGADDALEKEIFRDFIEAGAAEARRRRDRRLARETFLAAELNRSASLRESAALAGPLRSKLGTAFWDTLAELRSEEAKRLPNAAKDSDRESRLKLKLTEMEAAAGVGIPVNQAVNNTENFRSQTSLTHFQNGLGNAELLLSFHLGESESYLWAVTRTTISLHRLPAPARIRTQARAFGEAVRRSAPEASRAGERLYRELFGGLSEAEVRRPDWLLSVEDALFELPFAALVTERKGANVKYLVEDHSVQLVPGAMSLRRAVNGGTGNDWFLGVGDPIYNTADPRWRQPRAHGVLWNPAAHAAGREGAVQLSRLVESGKEVETSAHGWGVERAEVLLGANASRERFLKALAHRPAVVHLATHVLATPGRSEALVAFGLGPSGESELLTTSEVARLQAPGALVVMSGCDTSTGQIRSGAGLVGLTRAWQLAGASAVLSTKWEVEDWSGEIFASFYRELHRTSAAKALRISQMDMIRSGTWRARPAYWAAYELTGGVH